MILTHYFPLTISNPEIVTTSITEYSEEEQQSIAAQLSHYSGRALRRFDQFSKYISKRHETENWLYSTFLEAGGQPVSIYPFYFVVGENQQLKYDFGTNVKTIKLDTNLINPIHISFTLGDSMGIYSSSAPNKIYLLNELEDMILNSELIYQQMKPLNPYHRYIEAQLWDKLYLNNATI